MGIKNMPMLVDVCCMDCTKKNTCIYTTNTTGSSCHDCWLEGEPLETDEWQCDEKMPCAAFVENKEVGRSKNDK
jgi:hypothetical protein